MRDLPSGTVTFLFTDIEDSTQLLRSLGGEGYSAALATHRRAVRDAVARHAGVEVDTQGDAFLIAFPEARGALDAAVDAQRALSAGPIHVRMGLHTGTPLVGPEGYVGEDVHLGARIASAGHGGQILMSRQTREGAAARADVKLVDLGEHRVKGFTEPVWIFQVGDAKFPPLRTISNTNLPRPASSFVGRRAEVEQLTAAIRKGSRLVTLTGPGGTGKTRLAIEAAASLVADFKNGVFWVGLASVSDPAVVMQTVGEVLGAKGELAEHIADRQMLLVLDNFEQIIDAAAEVSQLLSRCPALHLIVTSRELLRVAGEGDYAVPVLAETEAVELFCERSNVTADATVAELCRRLDNLPLAIELAAARTRVMTVAQILERLGQRLDMLKGGRDRDPRQETLRATIQWSYDLLAPAEQQLFARLAIFSGGCTLATAEAVVGADIDALQSLLEKSLVRRVGERFRMLETIREFAAELLIAEDDKGLLSRRHAEHFLDLAGQAENEITGSGQNRWWQILTDETENIRAALTWACAGADPEIALRLTSLMWRFWWQRGHYAEGRRWYEAALSVGADQPDALQATARQGLGSMLMGMGQRAAAIEIFNGCLIVYKRDGDYERTVAALTDLGIAYTDVGEFERAQAMFEEGLQMSRAAGDVRRTAVCLINMGDLALLGNDLDRASSLLDEAYKGMLQAGDTQSAGNALGNRGQVELGRGNTDSAAKLLSESIRLSRQTDDRYSILHHLIVVAGLLNKKGAPESAATFLGRVEALQAEMSVAVNSTELRLMAATMSDLRNQLGDDRLEERLGAGRALDHDAGVELALAELAPPAGSSSSPTSSSPPSAI
ncbi:MAG: tetratricopeptide repeat protein [Candidatus Limnocylindrales bacterium]